MFKRLECIPCIFGKAPSWITGTSEPKYSWWRLADCHWKWPLAPSSLPPHTPKWKENQNPKLLCHLLQKQIYLWETKCWTQRNESFSLKPNQPCYFQSHSKQEKGNTHAKWTKRNVVERAREIERQWVGCMLWTRQTWVQSGHPIRFTKHYQNNFQLLIIPG